MDKINSRSVLLLNASYEPIDIITVRDAVSLILKEKVEEVHAPNGDRCVAVKLKTPSDVFEVPSMIRLTRYRHVPQRDVNWSKSNVLKRDQYRCIFCGIQIGDYRHGERMTKNDFTLEHLRPISRGGQNTWSNTACACYWCNHKKADKMPHEAGMNLLWEPKRPRVDYLVASGNIPEEWKIYIEIN